MNTQRLDKDIKDFVVRFKGERNLKMHRLLRQWCFDNETSIQKAMITMVEHFIRTRIDKDFDKEFDVEAIQRS